MSLEKPKTENEGIKNRSITEVESHSYSNIRDARNKLFQEISVLEEIGNNMEAFSVDIVEENNVKYAIVRRKKDNSLVYKSDSPAAMELLFPKKD